MEPNADFYQPYEQEPSWIYENSLDHIWFSVARFCRRIIPGKLSLFRSIHQRYLQRSGSHLIFTNHLPAAEITYQRSTSTSLNIILEYGLNRLLSSGKYYPDEALAAQFQELEESPWLSMR